MKGDEDDKSGIAKGLKDYYQEECWIMTNEDITNMRSDVLWMENEG